MNLLNRPAMMFFSAIFLLLIISAGCKKEKDVPLVTTVEDIDGNSYKFVTIGTQTWMAENLRTTRLNDGTPIEILTSNNIWSNTGNPSYCWFFHDANYKDKFGALYNFHAVNSGKLCPSGWHVPSDSEWLILENHLGGNSDAGGKLKEPGTIYWNEPNNGATNMSSFNARGSGVRLMNGSFHDLKNFALWWTSSTGGGGSWFKSVNNQSAMLNTQSYHPNNGLSVRCMKSTGK
jgi:uncharacterized protein (TIGR02145 family)